MTPAQETVYAVGNLLSERREAETFASVVAITRAAAELLARTDGADASKVQRAAGVLAEMLATDATKRMVSVGLRMTATVRRSESPGPVLYDPATAPRRPGATRRVTPMEPGSRGKHPMEYASFSARNLGVQTG